MIRYKVNRQGLAPEASLLLYRTIIAWAASRGDRFVLGLQPSIYDSPDDVDRLTAVGGATDHPIADGLISRFLASFSHDNSIQVHGSPDDAFVRELTRTPAPNRAVSGNESPVEYVIVFADERSVYVSYDYGTVQTLDLTEEDAESLGQTLAQAGFEDDRIMPMSA